MFAYMNTELEAESSHSKTQLNVSNRTFLFHADLCMNPIGIRSMGLSDFLLMIIATKVVHASLNVADLA